MFGKNRTHHLLGGEQKPTVSSDSLVRSYVVSLLISIPCLVLSVYFSQFHVVWWHPQTIFLVILFVSVLNFITLVVIDELKARHGKKPGSLTTPTLLAAAGLIMLFLIIEGVNRFFDFLDYHWLIPVIGGVMAFKYLAMFKEKHVALKFYLAINIITLAVLWGMARTGKIFLPF